MLNLDSCGDGDRDQVGGGKAIKRLESLPPVLREGVRKVSADPWGTPCVGERAKGTDA